MKEEDLDFEVIRVKALIVNNKNEILIAHNNNTYQFPGGHKEDDETLEKSLVREVKEETGIDVNLVMGPFMSITTYDFIDKFKQRGVMIYQYNRNADWSTKHMYYIQYEGIVMGMVYLSNDPFKK